MGKSTHKSIPESVLPSIVITTDEAYRLSALANSCIALFPHVAHFPARETERAKVIADDSGLRGVIRMGSQVGYSDDKTAD